MPPAMDRQAQQKELDVQVKLLSKCVAANEPAANAIAILETLKKNFTPTEEMLRVRRLRALPSSSPRFPLPNDGMVPD